MCEESIKYALSRCGYEALRPHQTEVLSHLIKYKDCLMCAPTGSGKSLIYEIVPFMFHHMATGTTEKNPNNSLVIVVSPLVALMKTQTKDLVSRGIRAAYFGDIDEEIEDLDCEEKQTYNIEHLKNGQLNILFGSPESFLHVQVKKLMKTIADQVKCLVIDEAHCIKKLGHADTGRKRPFRPDYSRLVELRSVFGEKPCVALTATATEQTIKVIIDDLAMQKCAQVIVSPQKDNIKYSIVDVLKGTDFEKNLEWLLRMVKNQREKMPRMLVFFRKMTYLTGAYEYLDSELGRDGYVNYTENGINDDRNHIFEMYHMKVPDEVKQSIVKSFMEPNGHRRLVLCSSSFSMGLNLRDVDIVVHYGVTSDLDDYIQQTGRAGRSGAQAHAVILKYKRCLAGKNIKPSVKSYIRATTCRRELLYCEYTNDIQSVKPLHRCCDICARLCTCQPHCDGLSPQFLKELHTDLESNSGSDTDESDINFSSDEDIEVYRNSKPTALNYSSDSE